MRETERASKNVGILCSLNSGIIFVIYLYMWWMYPTKAESMSMVSGARKEEIEASPSSLERLAARKASEEQSKHKCYFSPGDML